MSQKSIIQERFERIKEEITQITHDLSTTEATNGNVAMEERYFVGVFLPLFAEGSSPAGATLDTWVSYAGGPNRRVNVVNPQGEVLFVVPALFDRSCVRPVFTADGSRLFDILEMGKKMSAVHPAEGQRYIDTRLAERALLQKRAGADRIAMLHEWNEIFKRYGFPLIEVPGITPTTQSGTDPTVGSQDEDEWVSL